MKYPPLALIFLSACVGSLTQQTRTTLVTLEAVIEPMSRLADEQCDAEREALAEAHEPLKLEASIKRCDAIVGAFDRIAALHDAAAAALEAGDVKLAEDLAREVMREWQSMRGAK